MSYIISKNPDIHVNLMVKKEYMPELVSYVQRVGCKYEKEVLFDPGNGEEWVTLTNVNGSNGRDLGDLIGLFYSIEWKTLTEGKHDKFYMILGTNEKKGVKNYAGKNRTKIGQRSEGGDAGESSASA